jgi:hypothetical protein
MYRLRQVLIVWRFPPLSLVALLHLVLITQILDALCVV